MPMMDRVVRRFGVIGLIVLNVTYGWADTSSDRGMQNMSPETHVMVETGELSLPVLLEHLPLIETALRQAVGDEELLQRWNIPEAFIPTFSSTVSEAYVSEGDGRVLVGDWVLTTDGVNLRGQYTPLSDAGARMGMMFTADLDRKDDLWLVRHISMVRLR